MTNKLHQVQVEQRKKLSNLLTARAQHCLPSKGRS